MVDIRSKLNTPKHLEPLLGMHFAEVLYADDTLLFGSYTPHLNAFLKAIQQESKYYNLKLNFNKCVNLIANRKVTSVRFENGDLVPRKSRAVYLGTLLTDTLDHKAEINDRIAAVNATANKMRLFWNEAKTNPYLEI
jgi:hypothetical protein